MVCLNTIILILKMEFYSFKSIIKQVKIAGIFFFIKIDLATFKSVKTTTTQSIQIARKNKFVKKIQRKYTDVTY